MLKSINVLKTWPIEDNWQKDSNLNKAIRKKQRRYWKLNLIFDNLLNRKTLKYERFQVKPL